MAEITALLGALAELVKAIGQALVPILIFVYLWQFRHIIPEVVQRLKKGKVLGQEIELSEKLDRLEQQTEAAVQELPGSVSTALPPPRTDSGQTAPQVTPPMGAESPIDVTTRILASAGGSPELALLTISRELEHALQRYLSRAQPEARARNVPEMLRALLSKTHIPQVMAVAIEEFWHTRNAMIHGGDVNDAQIIRAVDSGSRLLETLLGSMGTADSRQRVSPAKALGQTPDGGTARDIGSDRNSVPPPVPPPGRETAPGD